MRAEHSSQDSSLILARLDPGDNLLGALVDMLEESDAPAAVVTSAIGSLSEVKYAHARTDKCGQIGYSAPQQLTASIEIAALQGHLGRTDTGEAQIHLHGVFVAGSGRIVAGHVLDGTVLVTVEVGLLTAADVGWRRSTSRDHRAFGLPILVPVAT